FAQWCPCPWCAVGAGGSRLISAGAQSKTPCSQPQNSVSAASRPTAPSCHQKLGTVTKPRQLHSLGANFDQTRAETNSSRTAGAQAPRASTGHAFFQLTPHSHHATQASSSEYCRPNASSSTHILPSTSSSSRKVGQSLYTVRFLLRRI